jgi:hypothetical protein
MLLFHRTSSADAARIIREGFGDASGAYMTTRRHVGVWLSDRPLDENEGAIGDTLLEVDLSLTEDAIAEYEWTEEGKPYREWLMPAELINGNARVAIAAER